MCSGSSIGMEGRRKIASAWNSNLDSARCVLSVCRAWMRGMTAPFSARAAKSGLTFWSSFGVVSGLQEIHSETTRPHLSLNDVAGRVWTGTLPCRQILKPAALLRKSVIDRQSYLLLAKQRKDEHDDVSADVLRCVGWTALEECMVISPDKGKGRSNEGCTQDSENGRGNRHHICLIPPRCAYKHPSWKHSPRTTRYSTRPKSDLNLRI